MSGADELDVSAWRPDLSSTKPLHRQIYERLRDAIHAGALKPGARLPSARALAGELGAARGTVDLAYSLLAGEGYIVSQGAAGTFVAEGLAAAVRRPARRSPKTERAAQAPLANSPTPVVPFSMSVPALDAFPRTLWCRLLTRHARRMTVEAMVGSEPEGQASLREAIVSYLAVSRGIRCHAGQVIITPGFQGALALLTRAYLRTGDSYWLEEPGYVYAREALAGVGARTVPVPVDADGLDVEQGIDRAPRARLVYVTPSHQAPLGCPLTLQRRLALLSWAARSEAWIIEDDYNGELRYGSAPLPALMSLDDRERVLYVGTFSKMLFPGLRLGYLVVPESEVERLRRLCSLLYLRTPPLIQAVVSDFMTEGHLARHVRRMRSLYERRRASLVDALHEVFADSLSVDPHAGGMFLIARGPALQDDQRVVANARAVGLAPSALSRWYADRRRAQQGLMLGFANIPSEKSLEAVTRLKQAIDA